MIILSPDTDVLVCSINNYSQLLYFGIDELWFISGKKNSRKFFPVHEVLDKIEPVVLPALHAQLAKSRLSQQVVVNFPMHFDRVS